MAWNPVSWQSVVSEKDKSAVIRLNTHVAPSAFLRVCVGRAEIKRSKNEVRKYNKTSDGWPSE